MDTTVRTNAKWKKFLIAIVPVFLFLSFSIVFTFFIKPENLVVWIGVNNAYLLIFLLALLGGLTTFSGVPYHLFLITMAVGGMDPFLLGASTAAGVMIGDSTSYYLGTRTETLIPTYMRRTLEKIYAWNDSRPYLFPLFCLAYGSCIPFSNDFITISAGIAHYPFWKVIIPLGIGNLIFNITLAYFALHAYPLIEHLFM